MLQRPFAALFQVVDFERQESLSTCCVDFILLESQRRPL